MAGSERNTYGALSPFRIAGIYVIIAVLWIIFSDRLLAGFVQDAATLTRMQTCKGWLFVAVTGCLLYYLVGRFQAGVIAEKTALAESEAKYRLLHESMTDAFGKVDMEGRILEFNTAFLELTGYTGAEITALTHRDLTPERWHAAEAKIIAEQVLTHGASEVYEKEYLRKDGSVIPVELRTFLIRAEDGTPAAMWAIVRDITDRKRIELELQKHHENLEEMVKERTLDLERSQKALQYLLEDVNEANERLRELDRLKSLFIASMSHELRTPLNSIIGFTGILLQGLAGPLNEEQKKQLGMVKGSSEHLLSLITDIIDLSKIEAGKIDISVQPFDLVETIRTVLATFGPAADRKGLSLELVAPPALRIASDQRRVLQILVNLVGNAVKFTEQGKVTVSVSAESDRVEVSVRDSGIGIRTEDMGKLFRSFGQITAADMPQHEGTGLGLYLSKRLVSLLSGEIRAESEFGRGSVFTFTLPMVTDERR